jgi:4-hydroxybenzoate polyprenyltransferase
VVRRLPLSHRGLNLPDSASTRGGPFAAPGTSDPAEDPGATAPLCLALETLLASDVALEGAFAVMRGGVLGPVRLARWAAGGGSHLRRQLADQLLPDPAGLPYDPGVLEFLKQERGAGRYVALTAAGPLQQARAVADHLGLFDEVVEVVADGSAAPGQAEADALCARFGDRGFDYLGSSADDLAVWRRARRVFAAHGSSRLLARLQSEGLAPARTLGARRPGVLAWARTFRVEQWAKNVLVVIPLITAHKVLDLREWKSALLAALCFCLTASAVYILNDISDVQSDRRHPTKRHRPLAAGVIPARKALLWPPLLLAISAGLTLLLPPAFAVLLATYITWAGAYSFRLKRVLIVDVLVLAGLYTLRIAAGAAAIDVRLSPWLLAFSLFLFLSLALLKRVSELVRLLQSGGLASHGRGYRTPDIEQLSSFGSASAYAAVLVLALYVYSPDVRLLYRHPDVIWALCPLLLYWLSRAWLLARRGELVEDPVVFALQDRRSHLVLALGLLFVLLATL